MLARVLVYSVMDTLHIELTAELEGQWVQLATCTMPDPDAPTVRDTVAYALGEFAEGLFQAGRQARLRYGQTDAT